MAITNWEYDKMKINVNTCKVPVVVEFWMPRCSPCVQLSTILEEVAEKFKNRAVFGKCRADEYEGDFPISTVPTTIININGAIFTVLQGLVTEEKLIDELEQAIEKMDMENNND